MNKLTKSCLLVRFTQNLTNKQEVLEIALKNEVIPFSAEKDENSFIFEAPSNEVLVAFHNDLENEGYAMETEMFYR